MKGGRALVTRGSRGIGGAIVRRLLSAGARVIAVARNPVEDFPADAAWIQGDVSSLEGVQAIVEQTSAILGGVDIMVNNAASGRIYPGGSLRVPDSGWEKLKPSILRYCVDNFTDEQLDGIIAFYKSPAGKAMLEKGPGLNQKTYDALQALQVHTKPLTDQATTEMKDNVQALIPPDSKSATPPTQSSAPSPKPSTSSSASFGTPASEN